MILLPQFSKSTEVYISDLIINLSYLMAVMSTINNTPESKNLIIEAIKSTNDIIEIADKYNKNDKGK